MARSAERKDARVPDTLGQSSDQQRETFRAFYTEHYRLVLTVAEQRLRGLSAAEDAAAETFRIAWGHHRDGGELSLPWVYRTLRNVIGNEYRRLRRSEELTQAAGPVLARADAEEPADALHIRRCIAELPDAERELIRMVYWEDLSSAEIAGILDCSAPAARVRLHRARRRLEALLNGRPGVVGVDAERRGAAS